MNWLSPIYPVLLTGIVFMFCTQLFYDISYSLYHYRDIDILSLPEPLYEFLHGKDIEKGTDYKDILTVARNFAEKSIPILFFKNGKFHKNIRITVSGIKEYLNQPHAHYFEKNELVKELPNLIQSAKYMGINPTYSHEQVKYSHIFETIIGGEKSWLIIREYNDGRVLFYSCSSDWKIATGLKKNNLESRGPEIQSGILSRYFPFRDARTIVWAASGTTIR